MGTRVYVVPKVEQLMADFGVRVPRDTQRLISFSGASGAVTPLLVLVALALLHAFGAAYWYPRAAPGQKLAYRLVLFLLIALTIGFVLLALSEPLVGLRGRPRAPAGAAPAGSAPAASPRGTSPAVR